MMPNRDLCWKNLISGLLCTILLTLVSCQTETIDESRPNILVIITDDQGYGDLSAFDELESILNLLDVSRNASLPHCEVCDVLGEFFNGDIPATCEANLEDDCWDVDQLVCP